MKLCCTKNTDKHENVTQVCTKYLNHPSRSRVRNQRVGIWVSVEEPVFKFERTDDQHRCGLYLCWSLSRWISHKIRTRATYQYETWRKQQHIDRPKTFHVSLGFLTSLLTCPPSELYDICHQSQRNRDLNSVKKVYERMRNVASSHRQHRSYQNGPTSATNHCWNSWYLFCLSVCDYFI